MLNQQEFLIKYNIESTAFDNTKLVWSELENLYNDYLIFKEELEPTAILLFNKLMKSKKVHSVRYRIKDPEHLIEKVIRKKIDDSQSDITIDNYKEEVTDLIGLRALHLFKEDWEMINDFIISHWDLKKKPIANYRKGDLENAVEFFVEKGCEPNEHKYGYRSIHYLIETKPGKQKYYAEIQIRTIFEEAWAEIDHTIRYPYDLKNPIFFQFLLILNRLSGSADEMGSFIQYLKSELEVREHDFKTQMKEKDSIIYDLETKIEKLNIQGIELNEVKADLQKLKDQKIKGAYFESGFFDVQNELQKFFKPSENMVRLSENLEFLKNYNNSIKSFQPINIDTLNSINNAANELNKVPDLVSPIRKLKGK